MVELCNRQALLFELLNYFRTGNFVSFANINRRIWNSEHPRFNSFLNHNQLQALHMAGCLDIKEAENSLRWSFIPPVGVSIESTRPKSIFSNLDIEYKVEPIIVDFNSNVLLVAKEGASSKSKGISFRPEEFFNRLPKISQVMNELLNEEEWPRNPAERVEHYNVERDIWIESSFDEVERPSLVRCQRGFSGRLYFIIIPEVRLAFRVMAPEWAFVLASNILNWDCEKLFFFTDQCLKVSARIKIPGLIKRYLFANCSLVMCGSNTEFQNMDKGTWDYLMKYIRSSELT